MGLKRESRPAGPGSLTKDKLQGRQRAHRFSGQDDYYNNRKSERKRTTAKGPWVSPRGTSVLRRRRASA